MDDFRIDLPLDILPLIVAELRHDTAALRTLSLVSRQWLSEAYRHLFSRLLVNENDPERNLSSFTQSMLVNLVICSSLRDLYIRGHAHQTTLELVEIITQLPNLGTLKLNNICFGRSLPSAPHEQLGTLSKPLTISLLELQYCTSSGDQPYSCLFDFIRVFSSIDVLSIWSPWGSLRWKEAGSVEGGTHDIEASPHRASVQKLFISISNFYRWGDLAALFLESVDMKNISWMGLIPWADELFDYQTLFQSLLDALTGIRHLRMELSKFSGQRLKPLSFASLHNLEVVEFLLLFRGNSKYEENKSAGCRMLSSLGSSFRFSQQQSPLSKVRFEIWLGVATSFPESHIDQNIKHIQWSELVTALESFRSLKTIEVIYYTPYTIVSDPSPTLQLPNPEDHSVSLRSQPGMSILDSTRSQLVGLALCGCEVIVQEETSKDGYPKWF